MVFTGNIFESLPSEKTFSPSWEPSYYGAVRILADRIGRKNITPFAPKTWLHGWNYSERIQHIRQIVGWGNQHDVHLVHNHNQLDYCKSEGWRHTHAVGAPFLYAEKSGRVRIPGALLVMPPHALKSAEAKSDEKKYIEEIKEISGDFSSVTFCIHPHDYEMGKWVFSLEKSGLPWILGASVQDENGLNRMRAIFDTVEFVTTNVIGSHIAYASYCGCKVSIHGTYYERNTDEFKNHSFYIQHPNLLGITCYESTEIFAKKKLPELFRHPLKSFQNISWAESELGSDNICSLNKISRIMGWSTLGKIVYRITKTNYAISE